MQCLKHREAAAVAICMGCGAAVCGDCTQRAVGHRIVCSNLCAEQLGQLLKASSDGLARASRSHVINAWFLWLLGGGMFLYSAYTVVTWKNWDFAVYGVMFGIVCVGSGFLFSQLSKRTPNPSPHTDTLPSGGSSVG